LVLRFSAMATAASCGRGGGSIYKDDAKGTWAGAFSPGWTPEDQRIRCKVTGRTKTGVGLSALPPA